MRAAAAALVSSQAETSAKTPCLSASSRVRAIEPLLGIELMRRRRPGHPDRDLARGPARLCRALSIDGRLDGTRVDRAGGAVELLGPPVGAETIAVARGPRVGIGRHGVWARRRWRFWVRGCGFVSAG